MLHRWLGPVRQALGAEATTRAWEAGRDMAAEQALDLALAATTAKKSPSLSRERGRTVNNDSCHVEQKIWSVVRRLCPVPTWRLLRNVQYQRFHKLPSLFCLVG
jgi:hypothetical protein